MKKYAVYAYLFILRQTLVGLYISKKKARYS